MRKNEDPQNSPRDVVSRSAIRTVSTCIRALSNGASTVTRSAVSAASSAINRVIESPHDQVLWSGFDKLEKEDGLTRKVLLLAFKSGYQVWDVEDRNNIHVIVSSLDGQASFMQMLPNPINPDDSYTDKRPLLAICGGSSWSEEDKTETEIFVVPTIVPKNVYIYSLKTQCYVRTLKFNDMVYTVRCSERIVAVLQANQIHCFDANTLEREYITSSNYIEYDSFSVGYGPLAVGPRWFAYSGSRITKPSFTSQPITLSSSVSPTVAQFAKEPSKQIASSMLSLGDKGYRSLSKYCSEVLPSPYIPGLKSIRVAPANEYENSSKGMVIVKDTVDRDVVIAQFEAHDSPIAALCFDPSGMLLVTASTQGHHINVFRITPNGYTHLFALHRGYTNAVIQDISFSNDSKLIVVSSTKGTSHLFEIQETNETETTPVSVSKSNMIKSGNSNVGGLVGTVSNAASAAVGMVGGSIQGAITSSFCNKSEGEEKDKRGNYYGSVSVSSSSSSSERGNLLVFDHSGVMTEYALTENTVKDGNEECSLGVEFGLEKEVKVLVEAIKRWAIVDNRSRREVEERNYSGVVEEAWRASNKKKGGKAVVGVARVEYIAEAELKTCERKPLWERIKFQKLGLDGASSSGGGGGEMEIEGMETRTIEARTRPLVPVTRGSRSITQEAASVESQGRTETTEHSKEEKLRSGEGSSKSKVEEEEVVQSKTVHGKEESVRSEEGSSKLEEEVGEEEDQSKPVNKEEEGIAEEKNDSEVEEVQSKTEEGSSTKSEEGETESKTVNRGEEGVAEEKNDSEVEELV